MKEKILKKLGSNHTKTVELLFPKQNEPYGLYTYQNDIFVLKNGNEISFDDLTEVEKTNVTNQILFNKYKINSTLQ